MAISLSEQLESDIKEYLHKTFGTYFSSLDERFAADIKEDVINTSDFHHGFYNDDDISIAFQRVTLGMEVGSMCGWDVPGADPAKYEEDYRPQMGGMTLE